jgi:hypothetical protein
MIMQCSMRYFLRHFTILVFFMAFILHPQPSQAKESNLLNLQALSGNTAETQTQIHGFLSTSYKFRATADDSDQDIYQYLNMEMGDPRQQRVTAHIFGRWSADIDGGHDENGHYVFDSISDSHDNNIMGSLYYAYIDVHGRENFDIIRAGRQAMYEAPEPLYFDGAKFESKESTSPFRFKFGLYGGDPVDDLYGSDSDEDWLVGAFLKIRPWQRGRAQVHWTYVEEDDTHGYQKDNFYSVELWQQVKDNLRLNTRFTGLDEDPRDIQFKIDYYNQEMDLILQGSYYELLVTQEINTLVFDPYYSSAMQYFPYRQIGLIFYKGIGEHTAIDGGVWARILKNEDDEGEYNHEFIRYFASVYVDDVPKDGLEFSISGEVWESYTKEEITYSVDAEAGYEFSDKLKVFLGTDYSFYKYDYYLDTERDEVRTYYGRLKYKPVKNIVLDLNYQYEDDDFSDYYRLKADIRWIF